MNNLLVSLIAIVISSILTENYVLRQAIGICPFLGVSNKMKTAVGMSLAVIFVMTMAVAVTWPIQKFILTKLGLEYLQTIVFILVIAALVQLVEAVLKKYIPALHKALGVYLPLITTNCAVLAITVLCADRTGSMLYGAQYGYLSALVNAVGAGLGYLVAMVLFSGVRQRIERSEIPEFLKGIPITLIAASIISVAFLGFDDNIVKNLLGVK